MLNKLRLKDRGIMMRHTKSLLEANVVAYSMIIQIQPSDMILPEACGYINVSLTGYKLNMREL